MGASFKHIGLIIGIVLVFISFLFFGRQQNVYSILIISGLLLSLISYIVILVSKASLKSKIVCSGFVILCIILQQLTEGILIDASFRIYIKNNKKLLAELNTMLAHKHGDITIIQDSIHSLGEPLTASERNMLSNGRKELGVYMISSSKKEIYYGLYGFLDIRLGIRYPLDKVETSDNYRFLTDNWYR